MLYNQDGTLTIVQLLTMLLNLILLNGREIGIKSNMIKVIHDGSQESVLLKVIGRDQMETWISDIELSTRFCSINILMLVDSSKTAKLEARMVLQMEFVVLL